MHVLLVYCHPRPDSFCAAVRDAALAALREGGHTVALCDLYAEGFAPAMRAAERGRYFDESANTAGIEDHVAALRRAEALVLVYPTWWYGLPAMLKGWLERVWVPGVAFRLDGGKLVPLLRNIRRVAVLTTYGSPRWWLSIVGWPDWRLIRAALRRECTGGCRLQWLGLTGMDTATARDRARFLARVRRRLAAWQ